MEITLSENIRKFRKERRLTQEQLAEVMGVTTGAVHKWESGLSVPDISLIVELADFFDKLTLEVPVISSGQFEDLRESVNPERLKNHPIMMKENIIWLVRLSRI